MPRPSFSFLLGALLSLTHIKLAATQEFITIHASVVFTRTGERTPIIEQWQDIVQLTSTGAQQAYAAGTYLRDRYMPAVQNESDTSAAIYGLSPFMMNPEDIYILAADSQYIATSATAFMQGLYPPARLDASSPSQLQANAILANGSYVSAPLGGYQYAWIHTASNNDPESIFVNGENYCPEWNDFNQNYFSTPAFNATMNQSEPLYSAVSGALADFNLQQPGYHYWYAYEVYDYLSFMYVHNTTYFDTLNAPSLVGGNALNQLRYLADQSEYAIYGNQNTDPAANYNEISTIAGQTFATKALELLTENIRTSGAGTKLNLLFGEYPAFLSFFALANLPAVSLNFTGLPEWGSSMIFELFSYSNSSTTNTSTTNTYPPESDLHVRFLFRNGTTHPLQPYPLFATSTPSIPWLTFVDHMHRLTIPDIGTWCSLCHSWSETVFCAAWNTSTPPPPPITSSSSSILTPKTAGVIGAIATLSALGLLLVAAVGCCGLRVKRVDGGRRKAQFGQGGGGGGGFKGGMKLASDTDLTLGGGGVKREREEGKRGAGIVMVEEQGQGQGGKERVGSWELEEHQNQKWNWNQNQNQNQNHKVRAKHEQRPRSSARRRNEEEEEEDGYISPLEEEEAVRPEERV